MYKIKLSQQYRAIVCLLAQLRILWGGVVYFKGEETEVSGLMSCTWIYSYINKRVRSPLERSHCLHNHIDSESKFQLLRVTKCIWHLIFILQPVTGCLPQASVVCLCRALKARAYLGNSEWFLAFISVLVHHTNYCIGFHLILLQYYSKD